jgi:hypothetical protein
MAKELLNDRLSVIWNKKRGALIKGGSYVTAEDAFWSISALR